MDMRLEMIVFCILGIERAREGEPCFVEQGCESKQDRAENDYFH